MHPGQAPAQQIRYTHVRRVPDGRKPGKRLHCHVSDRRSNPSAGCDGPDNQGTDAGLHSDSEFVTLGRHTTNDLPIFWWLILNAERISPFGGSVMATIMLCECWLHRCELMRTCYDRCIVLTQQEADTLIAMDKQLADPSTPVVFPFPGSTVTVPLSSLDGRERFQLDLECGRALPRWKLQLRNKSVYILVRADFGGPDHRNPPSAPSRRLAQYEGKRIPTPHLQRYVAGYGDQWATPLPADFTDPVDRATTWIEFLAYCNIVGAPQLQRSF